MSGVSYRLIHKIMHDEANPRDVTLGKIAAALGVSSAELMGVKNDDAPATLGEYPAAKSTVMVLRDGPKVQDKTASHMTIADCVRWLAQQFDVDEAALRQAILDVAMKGKKSKEAEL